MRKVYLSNIANKDRPLMEQALKEWGGTCIGIDDDPMPSEPHETTYALARPSMIGEYFSVYILVNPSNGWGASDFWRTVARLRAKPEWSTYYRLCEDD